MRCKMNYLTFLNNFNELNIFIYTIKLCFIVIFSSYSYFKLLNEKNLNKIKWIYFILINFAVAVICSILKSIR